MLAQLDHVNIVSFVGYCRDPFLLIIMEFVAGGTLSEFVATRDALEPPTFDMTIKILFGSAAAFEYLHCNEPMPILHRDIKSENILLTELLEPRVADLGEARVMASDHAMTAVGTPGYTAPEVLRGEHYGTAADVFSFAVVMCELLTLVSVDVRRSSWREHLFLSHTEHVYPTFPQRAPYSTVMKGDDGKQILSWEQVNVMTAKKDGGLRPYLPDTMSSM